MNIKQRHFIKSSEIKTLKDDILKQYGQTFINQIFPKKCRIEWILTEAGDELFAVNNELKVYKSSEDGYIPVLTQLFDNKIDLKAVVVDMGAIKFVALSKADVMRPGITEIDPTIKEGEIIQIVDEKNRRAIAIGKALFNAEEMQAKKKGKVIKNLHTIKKDPIWKFAQSWNK